jgi:hypothetical protein
VRQGYGYTVVGGAMKACEKESLCLRLGMLAQQHRGQHKQGRLPSGAESVGAWLACMAPSMRPTVCVMNWVDAASWSCSSQLISTMLHPSRSKNCSGERQGSVGWGTDGKQMRGRRLRADITKNVPRGVACWGLHADRQTGL